MCICRSLSTCLYLFFFLNDTAPTEIYTLSLHDALPISQRTIQLASWASPPLMTASCAVRSEEHTSELQSLAYIVCRLLLEKTKNIHIELRSYYINKIDCDTKQHESK